MSLRIRLFPERWHVRPRRAPSLQPAANLTASFHPVVSWTVPREFYATGRAPGQRLSPN